MYTLAVRREFIARHQLIGGDWGAENFPNSHHYVLELQLDGAVLDKHGYLVDIVDVEARLGEVVGRYREKLLNELPEFKGLNPSLENFVRIVAIVLNKEIQASNVTGLRVVLWENESAWASYFVDRRPSAAV